MEKGNITLEEKYLSEEEIERLIEIAEESDPCKEQLNVLMDCKTTSSVVDLIKANWEWVARSEILTEEVFHILDIRLCKKNGLFRNESVSSGYVVIDEPFVEGTPMYYIRGIGTKAAVYGSSRVRALVGTIVLAKNDSHVRAYDAMVYLYNRASCVATGRSEIEMFNTTSATASDMCHIFALGKSELIAQGNCIVHAVDSASISLTENSIAKVENKCKVVANDYAVVVSKGRCEIKLFGSSYCKASSYESIEAFGRSRVEAFGGAKVVCDEFSTVLLNDFAKATMRGDSFAMIFNERCEAISESTNSIIKSVFKSSEKIQN